MFQLKTRRDATCLAVVLFCLSTSFYCSTLSAQTGESVEELKAKVAELTEQTKYVEALPLLEKLVVAEPNNAQAHFYLGFALIARANNTNDADQRMAVSKRACCFRESKRIEYSRTGGGRSDRKHPARRFSRSVLFREYCGQQLDDGS